MKKQILYFLTTIFLASFFISCASASESEGRFFEGDIRTLLIQEAEVPLGWSLDRSASNPADEEVAANWVVVYGSRPTLDHMTTVITHYVGTFKQQEVAIERFEYGYQDYYSPTVEPPQEYRYKSTIADEFKITCTSVKNLDGLHIGYNCMYSALYGNAMSDLIVYIEREDGVKTGEANLLPWTEVERLLELIDDKFQRAGF